MVSRSGFPVWLVANGLLDDTRVLERTPLSALYKPFGSTEDAQSFLAEFEFTVSMLAAADAPISLRLRELVTHPCVCIDPRVSRATIDCEVHITQQWMMDIASQMSGRGIAQCVEYDLPVLQTSTSATNTARDTQKHTRRLTLLCHPGSGGVAKCCPLDPFERVVFRSRAYGFDPRWMIGPDESERFGPEYVSRLSDTAEVVYREDVRDAADRVATADAHIGNDAGMTHVAALMGIPTLALFGPTDPRVWRPIGANVGVFRFPATNEPIDAWADGALDSLQVLMEQARRNGRSRRIVFPPRGPDA